MNKMCPNYFFDLYESDYEPLAFSGIFSNSIL